MPWMIQRMELYFFLLITATLPATALIEAIRNAYLHVLRSFTKYVPDACEKVVPQTHRQLPKIPLVVCRTNKVRDCPTFVSTSPHMFPHNGLPILGSVRTPVRLICGFPAGFANDKCPALATSAVNVLSSWLL